MDGLRQRYRKPVRTGLLAASVAVISAALLPGGAMAQGTGGARLIVAGGAAGQAGGAPALEAGRWVTAPPNGWAEIVFPDGTSVAIEPGAEVRLLGVSDQPSGRHVRLEARGGRIRVSAGRRTEILLQLPGGAELRLTGAAALVQAEPNGSAQLMDPGRMTLRRADGQEEVVRRPGFVVAFGSGGPQRQSQENIAAAAGLFAPITAAEVRTSTRSGNAPTVASPSETSLARPSLLAQRPGGTDQSQLQPPPFTPPPPAPPPPTPPPAPSPRAGDSFSLASALLAGDATPGSTIAAPRANSNTSSIGSGTQITPDGQEGDLLLMGLSAIQPQGTVRVRRFAPAGASGDRSQRSDYGVVTPPGGSLAPGQPASGVAGAYFTNLAIGSLAITPDRTFYDATANVGVVVLRTFEPALQPFDDGHLVNVPRYYLTDASTPSLTYSNTSLTTTRLDRATNQFVAVTSPGGMTTLSPTELFALGGAIYITFEDNPGSPGSDVRIYRYDQPNQQLVQILPAAGAEGANPDSFSAAGEAAFRQSLGQLVTGDVHYARGVHQQLVNYTVHRAGALLEVELQARGHPAVNQPGPASGPVFVLSGGNGLAVQVGGEPLPGVTIAGTVIPTVNAPSGPATPGGVDLQDSFGPTIPIVERTFNIISPSATVVPDVIIIDKLTASSEAIFNERGIQSGERYFAIGGRALTPPVDGSLPGAAPGTVTRFAISDGLNPFGGFLPGYTIQSQFLGPGDQIQPVAFNLFNAFRPEGTFVGANTATQPRGDTHLLVIAGTGGRHPAMRADLEVMADGRSSASAAVGGIARLPAGDGSLALSGALVGSVRPGTRGATAIQSNFGSLGTDASGYGAHLFGGNDLAPGGIGYFAVGESDTRLGAPGTPGGVQPGTLQNVGEAALAGQFGFTRLATNVGTPATNGVPFGPLPAGGLQGFASFVVESFEAGQGSIFALSTPFLGGVDIQPANGGREFVATYALTPTAVGERSAADPLAAPAPEGRRSARTVQIAPDGGAVPRTAVASPGSFAGVSPASATKATASGMASVDSDLLRGIQRPDGTPAAVQRAGNGTVTREGLPPSNEHLAWGYFLGDVVNEANGTRRDYVGMGFWVAGRPVELDTLSSLTGTARYGGGMIGTVADQVNGAARLRTVAGDFAGEWNFATRSGSIGANFDSRSYAVGATMPGGSRVFSGEGTSGAHTMAMQGSFFHNPAAGGPVSNQNLPAAVGGIFGVRGPAYGANGVFVGARRSP